MKRIVIAFLLMFAISVNFTGASALYSEDLNGHWAADVITVSEFAQVLYEDEDFHSNKAITRIEFARLIHEALDININYFRAPDIQEIFSDVSNDEAGAMELYDLVTTGIVKDKELFRPHDILRRDEMIHYVMNAVRYATDGNYFVILMMPEPFDDEDLMIKEYKNDVTEAVLLGIIKGRGNNMLYPAHATTRAEAVVAISRMLDAVRRFAAVDVSAEAIPGKDSIEMKLTIVNNTKKPVTINHSSGQQFDFQLLDDEFNVLYTWSADKLFSMMLSETVIDVGDSVEFSATLDGDQYASIKDRIYLLKGFIKGTSESFEIREFGYEYFIVR
mgnify:CR=1 FL=1